MNLSRPVNLKLQIREVNTKVVGVKAEVANLERVNSRRKKESL